MNVGKAWHYLLVHPEKGYYTGYKGPEAFGTLEDAKIYRTEQEAYMARLVAGLDVYVESCLLWHNRTASNLSAPGTEDSSSAISHSASQNNSQNSSQNKAKQTSTLLGTSGRTKSSTSIGRKKRFPFTLISNPQGHLLTEPAHSDTRGKSNVRPVTLRLVT